MPRPQKATADYYQHFIKRGKTMFIVESKHGNDGYALWFKTLELLTGTEHHYLDFNDDALWEYYLTFVNLDNQKASEILNLLAKLNAIDGDLWQLKIVWCENLIVNLSGLYNKRLFKPMDKYQIMVVSGAETPNTGITGAETPKLSINRVENPQSIVENSIEEKRREKEPTFSDLDYDESKCKNDYEILYPFYSLIKSYNPKFGIVTGNIQPAYLQAMVLNLNDLKRECQKCNEDFIPFFTRKLSQTYWVEKLNNSKNYTAKIISDAAGYAVTDLKKQIASKPVEPPVKMWDGKTSIEIREGIGRG